MDWTDRRERLRAVINGPRCIYPGSVYDPISARIAEDLGFEAGMFAGSVASLAVLGAPDIVVLTLSEFAGLALRIRSGLRSTSPGRLFRLALFLFAGLQMVVYVFTYPLFAAQAGCINWYYVPQVILVVELVASVFDAAAAFALSTGNHWRALRPSVLSATAAALLVIAAIGYTHTVIVLPGWISISGSPPRACSTATPLRAPESRASASGHRHSSSKETGSSATSTVSSTRRSSSEPTFVRVPRNSPCVIRKWSTCPITWAT